MAKKKVTPPSVESKSETTNGLSPQGPEMASLNEELENLKSLNSKVVKEAFERKRQIDSLVKVKSALEEELERLGIEKVGLENELRQTAEDGAITEFERSLLCQFIENQVWGTRLCLKELGSEAKEKEECIELLRKQVDVLALEVKEERGRKENVCQERDLLTSKLVNSGQEARELRVAVLEFERKEREIQEEIGKLDVLLEDLKKERIEEVRRVKESADEELKVKAKELKDMVQVIEVLKGEKKVVEDEIDGHKIRVADLEKEVAELNEIVLRSKKEEEVLRAKILALETSYSEVLLKIKAIEDQLGEMEKENSEKVREIERLMEEKQSSLEAHHHVTMEKRSKEEEISRLIMEKEVIENAKSCKETELDGLQKALDSLNNDVVVLQSTIQDRDSKIHELVSHVSSHKDSVERIQLERDILKEDLNEERENLKKLRTEVQEMGMEIEETTTELAKMKIENENLINDKEEMEQCIELLKKEKETALSSLSDAEFEISGMKTKSESASLISQKAFAMVRDIAASVREQCNGGTDDAVSAKKRDIGIDDYEMELEAIRRALESKEVAVNEMKLRVHALQSSVEDANRKTGFLTVLSSVTTVFAAIFLACGNRIR